MKKMRKLIPAFAMLLVSAIMMSTASFAWFTMNEEVTATGMQVQARASGNLLISTAPLTALDQEIEVDFTDAGKKELTPITHRPAVEDDDATTDKDETKDAVWEVPTDLKLVNPITGVYEGGWTPVTTLSDVSNSKYFKEYVVYIATADNDMTEQDLYITIDGLAGVDQDIAPAYTIAFYVGNNTTWTEPDATVNYLTKTALVAENVTIPSNYNATTGVGLKVVMRIYVDGDLTNEAAAQIDVTTPNYKAFTQGTKYNAAEMAGYKFYQKIVAADGSWTAGAEVTMQDYWTAETVLNDYVYLTSANDVTTTKVSPKYVNNTDIPVTGTTFAVDFSVEDHPAEDDDNQ